MAMNRVTETVDLVNVKNALVSVSDKSGLDSLIPSLVDSCPGIRFFSTGGTYAHLGSILGPNGRERLFSVSDYTGQPEMQGGLVKTLDFKIYLGLLSEPFNSEHAADIERVGGVTFDLVLVNLYPFAESVSRTGATLEDARANIDIGGPCMLRAAAKNFLRVTPVCDPGRYENLADEVRIRGGKTTLFFRFARAREAFRHTASYDRAVASYLEKLSEDAAGEYYRIRE